MYQLSVIYEMQVDRIRPKVDALLKSHQSNRRDRRILQQIRNYDKTLFFFFVACLRNYGDWNYWLEDQDPTVTNYQPRKLIKNMESEFDMQTIYKRYLKVVDPPCEMYSGNLSI
jgi:hypothetical protein